jgi:hypothetical protein
MSRPALFAKAATPAQCFWCLRNRPPHSLQLETGSKKADIPIIRIITMSGLHLYSIT